MRCHRRSVLSVLLVLGLVSTLAGCGGGSKPDPTAASGTPASLPSSGPAPGSSGSPVSPPIIVQVAAGQTAGGVDITVPGAAAAPPPNAQVLGVAPVGAGGSAFNTGALIHRGATSKVILFGPGLVAGMEVIVGGPSDVAVSNVRPITSTSGTGGIAFDAAVSGNAALGARTVFLRNSQNDITAFAGGLEVVP